LDAACPGATSLAYITTSVVSIGSDYIA